MRRILCVFLIYRLHHCASLFPSMLIPEEQMQTAVIMTIPPGEYHYHHGYPAHQHTGGVCPYAFDDRTGWNSGSSSGSSSSSDAPSDSVAAASGTGKSDSSGSSKSLFVHPLLLCLGAIMLARLLRGFYKRRKLRAQKALEKNSGEMPFWLNRRK